MKKAFALLLAFAMALSLAACAQTPDSAIVAQKNNERLVEAATTEDENRQSLQETQSSAPERYTFDYTSEDGMVEITADAEVILPETDTIPMYQLSCTGFTQEQATAIYDYLLQGKETWIMTGEDYTKEMADEDLLEAKQKLAEVEADTEGSEEDRESQKQQYQDIIDSIEEIYHTLPDTSKAEKMPVDSTYRTQEIQTLKGVEEFQGLEANTDEGDLLIVNKFELGSDGASQVYFSGATELDYEINSMDGEAVTREEAEALCKCDLSYDEAKALADGLFDAVGVETQLVQTSLLKGCISSPDEETSPDAAYVYEDDYSAYIFCYGRIVDGTPVAVTASQYVPNEDTAPTWLYEYIQIAVNSDGIIGVKWMYPVTVDETIASDVSILPFETAAETFETMAPLIYQGNIEAESDSTVQRSYQVNVERVELNLMRVKDSGNERTGLYVPAWVFYGTETKYTSYADMEDEHGVTEPSPWIILAVNAIDGSVIDVVNGY